MEDSPKELKKKRDIFMRREKEFKESLDNIFDIAHAEAFQLIKIEEDKVFLLGQRELGRVGCLGGIYSTACMPERTRTEGINPNGLGACRMRSIPSEYSNQKKTKETAFITEKNLQSRTPKPNDI
ncbi:hypothetical protein AVEN_79437-1 [Araneus ventricosus]|uniref:Uncharacterized protein n=1 Tax=Araneus ventricosus TaxID=182803 RepID=A0A4Y2I1L0_ARAVE|nr:hypothetical protein AVEN_79437-1 [Araneus ventricosus]